MTKYLISFPSEAMVVTDEEFPSVVADSHAVIEEAKKAGVYVFGGGINDQVAPVLASISEVVADISGGSSARAVLYGGSVTSANIDEFFAEPAIDGALVGGASLKPDEMAGIVARAGMTARARGGAR